MLFAVASAVVARTMSLFSFSTNSDKLTAAAVSLSFLLLLPESAVFAQPDLVISGSLEDGDKFSEAGDRVQVEYRITNIGNRSAPGFEVGFYLSYHMTFDINDTFIERDSIGDLDSSDDEDEPEEIALPNFSDGEHFVLAVADDLDQIVG